MSLLSDLRRTVEEAQRQSHDIVTIRIGLPEAQELVRLLDEVQQGTSERGA